MRPRLRIGLTGGIASGKSIVSARFEELGVPVIDADLASRVVVKPGTPGLSHLVRRFGAEILGRNGELDRRKLRNMIFNDSSLRRDLDGIMHPLIRAEMEHQAAAAHGPYLIMVIPLLVEGGSPHDRVDRVLVIDAEEGAQCQRVQERDGSSVEQARAILGSQASRAARLAAADDVLLNTGSVAELLLGVNDLHQQYLRLAKSSLEPRNLT
jgi:dephospho-CoA kinase